MFLPKSCVGSTSTDSRGHAAARRPARAAAGSVATTSSSTPSRGVVGRAPARVLHPERVGARDGARPCASRRPDAARPRDLHQARVVPGPGVVDQVRARVDRRARHLRAPGVDADQQVRVTARGPPDERDDAADLLGRLDPRAAAGPHAADVDDVGALGARPRDGRAAASSSQPRAARRTSRCVRLTTAMTTGRPRGADLAPAQQSGRTRGGPRAGHRRRRAARPRSAARAARRAAVAAAAACSAARAARRARDDPHGLVGGRRRP